MKTVVLVGAGATLAEALPARPPRARQPPLDATFFELCRLASLDGLATVSRYAKHRFGIDVTSGRFRMEEVFNYIYSDAFAEGATDECLAAYWQLIKMYANAIARTTNGLSGTSRCGVGALVRHFYADAVSGDLTFITFNQDLLIEKALHATQEVKKYGSLPFSIDSCYRLPFENTIFTRSGPRFTSAGGPSVPVLKLHGSLNWTFNVRSGADPKNSIRKPPGKLHLLNSSRVRMDLKLDLGKRVIDVVPLVVPPIYEKASRYQEAVAPVWDAARKALAECTQLVVFGYSFPDADIAARSLLRSTSYQNTKLRQVTIIDPSASVAARIRELLDVDVTHHYSSAAVFCDIQR